MFKKSISWIVLAAFIINGNNIPNAKASSTGSPLVSLPVPGTMVNLSPSFEPALIKGVTVHSDNPFLFDFIVDTGHSQLQVASHKSQEEFKKEADRMVKYFFAALTVPEKDLWVNLSPYEKDRMVPEALGKTALGRDLLAQDYILKQLTASLIYPEKELGREFWNKVYAKAQAIYGTTVNIPVNTFNKVWILADKATVYEHGQSAFVVSGHLKVMLEEDYLSLEKHRGSKVTSHTLQEELSSPKVSIGDPGTSASQRLVSLGLKLGSRLKHSGTTNGVASQIIRDIVIPEIEKEVNTGKNFAMLRQIFNAQILATWYKKNLKEALINQVYSDKNTVKGLQYKNVVVPESFNRGPSALDSRQKHSGMTDIEAIYQQYLQAYKKGVFNYIKEEPQINGQMTPRKYFSGGYGVDPAMLNVTHDPMKGAIAIRPTGSDFALTVALNVNKKGDSAELSKRRIQKSLSRDQLEEDLNKEKENLRRLEYKLSKHEQTKKRIQNELSYYAKYKKYRSRNNNIIISGEDNLSLIDGIMASLKIEIALSKHRIKLLDKKVENKRNGKNGDSAQLSKRRTQISLNRDELENNLKEEMKNLRDLKYKLVELEQSKMRIQNELNYYATYIKNGSQNINNFRSKKNELSLINGKIASLKNEIDITRNRILFIENEINKKRNGDSAQLAKDKISLNKNTPEVSFEFPEGNTLTFSFKNNNQQSPSVRFYTLTRDQWGIRDPNNKLLVDDEINFEGIAKITILKTRITVLLLNDSKVIEIVIDKAMSSTDITYYKTDLDDDKISRIYELIRQNRIEFKFIISNSKAKGFSQLNDPFELEDLKTLLQAGPVKNSINISVNHRRSKSNEITKRELAILNQIVDIFNSNNQPDADTDEAMLTPAQEKEINTILKEEWRLTDEEIKPTSFIFELQDAALDRDIDEIIHRLESEFSIVFTKNEIRGLRKTSVTIQTLYDLVAQKLHPDQAMAEKQVRPREISPDAAIVSVSETLTNRGIAGQLQEQFQKRGDRDIDIELFYPLPMDQTIRSTEKLSVLISKFLQNANTVAKSLNANGQPTIVVTFDHYRKKDGITPVVHIVSENLFSDAAMVANDTALPDFLTKHNINTDDFNNHFILGENVVIKNESGEELLLSTFKDQIIKHLKTQGRLEFREEKIVLQGINLAILKSGRHRGISISDADAAMTTSDKVILAFIVVGIGVTSYLIKENIDLTIESTRQAAFADERARRWTFEHPDSTSGITRRTVFKGDTIASFVAMTGIKEEILKQANSIKEDGDLKPGMILILPGVTEFVFDVYLSSESSNDVAKFLYGDSKESNRIYNQYYNDRFLLREYTPQDGRTSLFGYYNEAELKRLKELVIPNLELRPDGLPRLSMEDDQQVPPPAVNPDLAMSAKRKDLSLPLPSDVRLPDLIRELRRINYQMGDPHLSIKKIDELTAKRNMILEKLKISKKDPKIQIVIKDDVPVIYFNSQNQAKRLKQLAEENQNYVISLVSLFSGETIVLSEPELDLAKIESFLVSHNGLFPKDRPVITVEAIQSSKNNIRKQEEIADQIFKILTSIPKESNTSPDAAMGSGISKKKFHDDLSKAFNRASEIAHTYKGSSRIIDIVLVTSQGQKVISNLKIDNQGGIPNRKGEIDQLVENYWQEGKIKEVRQFNYRVIIFFHDAAMIETPGGIDLNSANMGLTVTKDNHGGVKVNFDPAMIARIKAEGIRSAEPVIIKITPISPLELRPLLGLAPSRDEEEQLAKV